MRLETKVLSMCAAAAGSLTLVALIFAAGNSLISMTTRVDNDRRAIIAAVEGDCPEAWKRYHNSGGISSNTVQSYCPKPRHD